jgi:hypothetical protein
MWWPTLGALMLLLMATPLADANAQAPRILVEGLVLFTSGAERQECFDLPQGLLRVEGSSPWGRTGEDATLSVYNARASAASLDDISLAATLAPEPLSIEQRLVGGTYCYRIVITNRYPDTGDPNRPERPYKQVMLQITHEPAR